jgi:hypothetical protein
MRSFEEYVRDRKVNEGDGGRSLASILAGGGAGALIGGLLGGPWGMAAGGLLGPFIAGSGRVGKKYVMPHDGALRGHNMKKKMQK